MGLELEYIGGQTPVDDDEKQGLLIPSVTVKSELDEFEQQNIENAVQWTMSRSFSKDDILSEEFVRQLHRGCARRKSARATGLHMGKSDAVGEGRGAISAERALA